MNEKSYEGPERRATPVTEDKVSLMIEEAIDESMTKHEAKMTAMIRNEFNTLQELIKAAFPGGDPHGHRIAHEKAIRDASRWDQLKAEFISKAFTTGMMAAVGFLLLAAWEAFKGEIKK